MFMFVSHTAGAKQGVLAVAACSIPSMVVLLVHARGSSNQLAGFYLQPSWLLLLLLVVVSFS